MVIEALAQQGNFAIDRRHALADAGEDIEDAGEGLMHVPGRAQHLDELDEQRRLAAGEQEQCLQALFGVFQVFLAQQAILLDKEDCNHDDQRFFLLCVDVFGGCLHARTPFLPCLPARAGWRPELYKCSMVAGGTACTGKFRLDRRGLNFQPIGPIYIAGKPF